MKRLVDQALAHGGSVDIGGIDEVHAEIDRAPEQCVHCLCIEGFAPTLLSGDFRRTESDAIHLQIAADPQRS